MAATADTCRDCPYCGATFRLGDCPVVATNFEGADSLLRGDAAKQVVKLPSGQSYTRLLETGWPVLADPDSSPEREGRRTFFDDLAAVSRRSAAPPALAPVISAAARPEDIPARACPACEFPLPRDIDERPAVVIAVVGVNSVGKTHFLAASLTEAYLHNGLAPLGCTEFAPDEATGERFMTEFHAPVFRDGKVLDPNNPHEQGARFRPLVFNVKLARSAAFSAVFHDIAGETLADRSSRAVAATFLRAAKAIIFIIDPREIDALRPQFSKDVLESDPSGFDQAALLATCLRSNGPVESNGGVPVALTLAKADLVKDAMGPQFTFLERARPQHEKWGDFLARVRRISDDVVDFLQTVGAHSLLMPAMEYERRSAEAGTGGFVSAVTYHAVSALGQQPDTTNRALRLPVQPINCVDPLAVVLEQIALQLSAGDQA